MPTSLLQCLIAVAALTPPDCRLSDRERFPPQEVAKAELRFWRERRAWLDEQHPLYSYRRAEWANSYREADEQYHRWDWLNAAQGGEGRGPDYWLYSLRRLRWLIGEEAYAAGVMP